MKEKSKLKHGDIVPVEIAGSEIGNSVVSEITDEYIEVVWQGYAFKLPPSAVDYFGLRGQLT